MPSSEGYHIESGQKINDSTYIFIGYPLDENGRSTKIITTGEMIHNGEKYGLMNDKSEVVIPLTYDLIRLKLSCHYPYSRWAYGVIHTYPPDNHVVVFHNGKWGILDVTENKFILEDWERINGVYNNQYIVGKKTSAPTP